MAYTTFSTAKADYVLQLGYHYERCSVSLSSLRGIDALFLESAVGPEGIFGRGAYPFPQKEKALMYCEYNQIPVFLGDVFQSFSERRSAILRDNLILILAHLGLTMTGVDEYGDSDDEISPSLKSKAYVAFEFLLQGLCTQARNAVFARKIEEFIVPYLQESRKKERPKIGLVFGVGHAGLKEDLQSRRRRDLTLWNWRNLNFRSWYGFNREELDKVYEACHDGLEWQVTEHKTGLFA